MDNQLQPVKEEKRQYKATVPLSNKKYRCVVCERRFVLESTLEAHMHNVHKPKIEHECHICGKYFYPVFVFDAHMRLHERQIEQSRVIYNVRADNEARMEFHATTHTQEDFRYDATSHPQNVMAHSQNAATHTQNVMTHTQNTTPHTQEDFLYDASSHPQNGTTQTQNATTHTQNATTHTQEDLKYDATSYLQSATTHTQNATTHSLDATTHSQNATTHIQKKTKYDDCEKIESHLSTLVSATGDEEEIDEEDDTTDRDSEENEVKCIDVKVTEKDRHEICDSMYIFKDGKKVCKIPHVALSCKVCGKMFASYAYLQDHMTLHLKKYACLRCDKRFQLIDQWINHMITHDRHICRHPECRRSFKSATGLKIHKASHFRQKQLSNLQNAQYSVGITNPLELEGSQNNAELKHDDGAANVDSQCGQPIENVLTDEEDCEEIFVMEGIVKDEEADVTIKEETV